jgi:hypothetical protein
MAATLVGGAFLSASVQTIMDKLTSSEFRDFVNNKKLNMSLLKQFETTLLTLHAVLDDAEKKQINNLAVKQWLDELKGTIFDFEDLLNQISYDSLRCYQIVALSIIILVLFQFLAWEVLVKRPSRNFFTMIKKFKDILM